MSEKCSEAVPDGNAGCKVLQEKDQEISYAI